jgi:hypothetical protein
MGLSASLKSSARQVMMAATPVEGAPAGQTGASPAPSSAVKPGGVPRAPGSSIEESENLLHKLREFVESKGEGAGLPQSARVRPKPAPSSR